jgi:hypothetical protein
MRAPQRYVPLLLLPALLCQAGCIAMNIPSQRFHDPDDHGGLLGHWRTGGNACGLHHQPGHGHGGGPCLDGGPLEVDPFDPNVDADGQPKPPEVPWPRFHPVPTRPVFAKPLAGAPVTGSVHGGSSRNFC